MHHALIISDILGSIFKFNDTSTNAACACVCRAWQENALDMLWYRIRHLERLFRLLGPMTEIKPHLLTFAHHHISDERWDRFSFYANRVRELEYTDARPEIHYQSFSTLSISRPILHLVPNLTHLTWKKDPARPAASLVLCLLFLAPNLRSLSIETGRSSSQGDLFAIDNFFRGVVCRCPRIEHMEFHSDIPFHDLGSVLSNFLSDLPGLKSVLLSDTLISSDVVTALAKCPLLEVVRMLDPPEANVTETHTDDLQNFMPVLEHGAFPSIREIDVKAHLWNVTLFLRSEFPASRLRRLFVKTLSCEANKSIGLFFALIAEACPNIETLSLLIPDDTTDAESESISFTSLEPLLQCKSLNKFSLHMPLPLDIDNTQVAQMALCWPRLQKLLLNPFPSERRPVNKCPNLTVLSSFGQYCPNLRSLALCVESSDIPTPRNRKLLPKLEVLTLGLIGTGYGIEELALFLTDIAPTTCLVSGAPCATTESAIQGYFAHKKLDKVFALLPMLRSIHAQYRERLRLLEEDVQRLTSIGG